MNRTSARQDRLSALLTPRHAVALSLACGLACTPAPGEPYFGFEHTAEGTATLSPTPDGGLAISNLGSSGQDGVSIDLGEWRGHSIDLDIGEAGALAAGSCTYVYHPYDWRNGCIYTKETSSGSAALGIDGTGAQPTCVRVTLFDDGVAVDTRAFTGTVPASLVTGDMGTDPLTGERMSLRYTQVAFSYCYTVTLPGDSQLTIDGSALGAVTADQCVISLDGLPPGEPVTGEIRVLAANMPGGQLTIGAESVMVPLTHVSGTIGVLDGNGYASVSLNGNATGSGKINGDLCTFCPECCDADFQDLLQELGGLTVSNIGSSGEDGVSFAYHCCDKASPKLMHVNALDPDDDGDTIDLSAEGTLLGVPGTSPLGTCTVTNVAGTYQLSADYSALGSDVVRVEVLDGGTPSGFADIQNIAGIPLGQLLPAAGSTYTVNKCGKLPGVGGVSPPCFVACSPEPFTFIGGGQVLVGDELRVLAISATSTIDDIETLTLKGRGLPEFTCAPVYDPKAPAPWSGLLASPVDGADLEITPTGTLRVSNIGSSGCDGVRIDLGDADGSRVEFASGANFEPDVFFDIDYGLHDQYCATCPSVASLGVLVTPIDEATGTVQFRTRVSPAAFDVTLRDSAGAAIATFPVDDSSVLDVSGTVGDVVVVRRMDAASPELVQAARGEPVQGINISIGQETGGGVSVSDDAGVSHPGVHVISVTTTHAPVPNTTEYRGKVTLLKRTAAAGAVELELGSVHLIHAGSYLHAEDQARVEPEDCDDGSPGSKRLRVSNLGSSGCDGVSIDLGSDWCDGLDDDCDGIADNTADAVHVSLSGFDPDPDNNCAVVMAARANNNDATLGELMELILEDDGAGARTIGKCKGCLPGHVIIMKLYDDADQLVIEEGGFAPGDDTGTVNTMIPPDSVHMCINEEGVPSVKDVRVSASWNNPITVTVPSGATVGGVHRVEMVVRDSSGAMPDPASLARAEVRLAAHPGERVSFDVTGITVTPTPSCPADIDGDGDADPDDINAFVTLFIGPGLADIDGDGDEDPDDIRAFVNAFIAGCS